VADALNLHADAKVCKHTSIRVAARTPANLSYLAYGQHRDGGPARWTPYTDGLKLYFHQGPGARRHRGTDAETILLQVLNVERFGVHKSSCDEMLLSGAEHINSAAERPKLGLVSARTGPDGQAIFRTYPQQPDYSEIIVFS